MAKLTIAGQPPVWANTRLTTPWRRGPLQQRAPCFLLRLKAKSSLVKLAAHRRTPVCPSRRLRRTLAVRPAVSNHTGQMTLGFRLLGLVDNQRQRRSVRDRARHCGPNQCPGAPERPSGLSARPRKSSLGRASRRLRMRCSRKRPACPVLSRSEIIAAAPGRFAVQRFAQLTAQERLAPTRRRDDRDVPTALSEPRQQARPARDQRRDRIGPF